MPAAILIFSVHAFPVNDHPQIFLGIVFGNLAHFESRDFGVRLPVGLELLAFGAMVSFGHIVVIGLK